MKWISLLKSFLYTFSITISVILIILSSMTLYYLPDATINLSVVNRIMVDSVIKQDYAPEYYRLSLIEKLAANISDSREYVLHKYDCTDFSRDLVKVLKSNNISSRCVSGAWIGDNKISLHTWVEVNDIDLGRFYIEATAGYIIQEDYYREHYRIVGKGVCV